MTDMASKISLRTSDEERFQEFKARRLAKKEAERTKLAQQFPLLFGKEKKQFDAAVTAPTPKKTIKTPGKRRATIGQMNDENVANNSSSSKIPKPSSNIGSSRKTPLSSSKIPRKSINSKPQTQVCSSPKTNQKLFSQTAPASMLVNELQKVQELRSAKKLPHEEESVVVNEAISPMNETKVSDCEATAPSIAPVALPGMVKKNQAVPSFIQSSLMGGEAKDDEKEDSLPKDPLAPVVRKALFDDSDLQGATAATTSSQGDSTTNNTSHHDSSNRVSLTYNEIEAAVPATDDPSVLMVEEEKVVDVLDYLLEMDELDATTYKRVSSQRFSVASLKRLSVASAAPTPLVGSPAPSNPTAAVIDATSTTTSSIAPADEEKEGTSPRRPDLESADLAEPALTDLYSTPHHLQQEKEDNCSISDLQILAALRNYIATIETPLPTAVSASSPCATGTAPVNDIPVPDSNVVAEHDTAQLVVEAAANEVLPAVEIGTIEDVSAATNAEKRTSLPITTQRVSFCSAPMVIEDAAEEQDGADPQSLSDDLVPQTLPQDDGRHVTRVLTFPLRDLLETALHQGRVECRITNRIKAGENSVKYVVETTIQPESADAAAPVRMMCLKKYSDFKSLRTALLAAVEEQQMMKAAMQQKLQLGTGVETVDEMAVAAEEEEGEADSLLLLKPRSRRRSSVETAMSRDSLEGIGGNLGPGESGNASMNRRASDIVPPLPSRQVMSMSTNLTENSFEEARQAFLKSWLRSLFRKQDNEGDEFREQLRLFLQ